VGLHGSREYRVTQNFYGKSWGEELSKEITDTCHDFPCSPLR
jgi:hypothetical protein